MNNSIGLAFFIFLFLLIVGGAVSLPEILIWLENKFKEKRQK